jgi:hypothetical protein
MQTKKAVLNIIAYSIEIGEFELKETPAVM